MKKAMMISLAAVLMATVAWAQPGPNCPQPPNAPMAPGTGMGCGMHGGPGMMGHGKMGCGMHGKGMMGRGTQGAGIDRWAEELDLSDRQLEQLEQMRMDHRMQMIDARAELEKAQLRLRTLMDNENASEQEVMRAIDEVAQIRAGLQKARYSNHQQCLSVLTDNQRDQLEQLREERRDQRRELREDRREIRKERREFRSGRSGSSS